MLSTLLLALASQCAPLPAYPYPPDAVLGIREDPLAAYADLEARLYPHGIPVSERGFALAILREARLQQALGGPPPVAPAEPVPSRLPGASPVPIVPPVPLEVIPLSRRGLHTDAVRLRLDLGAAASGSVTLVLTARERELYARGGGLLVESERGVREIARHTRSFSDGGGTFDLPLGPIADDITDEAEAFVIVRVAGVGVASGSAGVVPLRTLTASGGFGGGVVLTSERPERQVVRP